MHLREKGSRVRRERIMKKRGILTLLVIFGGLFLGLLIFIGVLVTAFSPDGFGGPGDRLGIVEVDGAIMESKEVIENLRRFQKDETVKGVVVRVNSPGGAVAPSQEIFHAVQRLSETKPTVISMGTVAASGGYYVACGGERIFANAGSITGSIGVMTQLVNVERLVDRVDVDIHTLTTGQYKDAGSPFKPFEPQDEAYFRGMIDDIHRQFVEDVAQCREMEFSEALALADGRVFTGRQALDLKLVDEIGTLHDAIDHLAERVNLEDPKVIYPPEKRLGLMAELFQIAVRSSMTEIQDQSRSRVMYKYSGPQ